MSKLKFVFNDQKQKNSYGFYILTSGISLARFEKNPVMLDQHFNHTAAVLGKWEDWGVEGELLCGYPVFDIDDKDVKKIAGKVERGFIKSCSMGITFKHEDFAMIDGELVLTKCELYEVSLVAVPSNANSIRLYADNDKLLSEEEVKETVKELTLSLHPTPEQQEPEILTTTDMSKIVLSLAAFAALGLDSKQEHDNAAIEAAVLKLSNENATKTAKLLQLETAAELAKETAITGMVELAIKEGRIPATKKEDFINLAKANFDLAKSTIEGIPTKQSLGAQTNNTGTGGTEVKSLDDFMNLSLEEQKTFKETKPDEYQKLVN